MGTVELENAVLRDSSSTIRRVYNIKSNRQTVGTSGHLLPTRNDHVSLFPQIKLINKEDLGISCKQLGEGRFGKCFLHAYSHFKVCSKVFKKMNNSSFICEANILSQFSHPNLPFLFGVDITEPQSIVTSFHGVHDQPTTLISVLSSQSNVFANEKININWIDLLRQIACDLECLHSKHKLIHNDIKGDNIVLSLAPVVLNVKPVIIDFGKACEIAKGKTYKLTESEKDKYKQVHMHIAPDLRDGLCVQSTSSDVYSFGKLLNKTVNSHLAEHTELNDLSNKCMQYHHASHPKLHSILTLLSAFLIIY